MAETIPNVYREAQEAVDDLDRRLRALPDEELIAADGWGRMGQLAPGLGAELLAIALGVFRVRVAEEVIRRGHRLPDPPSPIRKATAKPDLRVVPTQD